MLYRVISRNQQRKLLSKRDFTEKSDALKLFSELTEPNTISELQKFDSDGRCHTIKEVKNF